MRIADTARAKDPVETVDEGQRGEFSQRNRFRYSRGYVFETGDYTSIEAVYTPFADRELSAGKIASALHLPYRSVSCWMDTGILRTEDNGTVSQQTFETFSQKSLGISRQDLRYILSVG